jgi:quercetin 2,3-dioxygenase
MDITIRKSNEYYSNTVNRNTAYYHFSFAEYYHPNNLNLGPLRAFNEYAFETFPESGLNWQSHRDIEIVTFLLDGKYEYKNNKGNDETISSGDVCVVSAGTGIISSIKINTHGEKVKLIEVWVYPSKYSVKPSWVRRNYPAEEYTDKLLPVVISEKSFENTIKVHQDVNFYMSRLSSQKEIEYIRDRERSAYLFIINGEISLNGDFLLNARDSAKIIKSSQNISLKNNQPYSSDLLLIDLPLD